MNQNPGIIGTKVGMTQIFTPEGKYLDEWGGFVQPAKIYVDGDGIMYVAELKGRVSILDLKGNLLARWGDPVLAACPAAGGSGWRWASTAGGAPGGNQDRRPGSWPCRGAG